MFSVTENEWNSLRRTMLDIRNDLQSIKQHFEKELLTADEACKILKISKPTFYRNVEAGLLESIKVGKKIKVARSELNRVLEQGIYDRLNNSGKN